MPAATQASAGALARLDSGEIDSLLAALIDEARRRGRLTPTLTAKLLEATRGTDEVPKARTAAKPAPPGRRQDPVANDTASLPIGKANAVRAAFMAGVKPATIARQFGISQSAVKTCTGLGRASAQGREPAYSRQIPVPAEIRKTDCLFRGFRLPVWRSREFPSK